jgi:hypothetical protein
VGLNPWGQSSGAMPAVHIVKVSMTGCRSGQYSSPTNDLILSVFVCLVGLLSPCLWPASGARVDVVGLPWMPGLLRSDFTPSIGTAGRVVCWLPVLP